MWPRCVGPGKQKRYRRSPCISPSCICEHQPVVIWIPCDLCTASQYMHVLAKEPVNEAAHMCAVALRALVKLGQRKSPWPRVLPPEHSDS